MCIRSGTKNHVMDTFRLIDRARRTVRGSADDIGWLQRDLSMPPVEDGTERFLEILDNIRYMQLLCVFYMPVSIDLQ